MKHSSLVRVSLVTALSTMLSAGFLIVACSSDDTGSSSGGGADAAKDTAPLPDTGPLPGDGGKDSPSADADADAPAQQCYIVGTGTDQIAQGNKACNDCVKQKCCIP